MRMAKQINKYRWLSLFLAPLVIIITYLLSFLPFSWLIKLGSGLGNLLYYLTPRLYASAQTNIKLCFPDDTPAQRKHLLKRMYRNLGIAAMEIIIGYYWSFHKLRSLIIDVKGGEEIKAAREKGIVLLTGHFTSFLLGARLLSTLMPLAGMYNHPKNKSLAIIFKGLLSPFTEALFNRKEVSGLIKYLKQQGCAIYLADIDSKSKRSIFVPFFGIPAATLTSPARIVKQSGAVLIPFTVYREKKGYVLNFNPPLTDFPSGDHYQDALKINRCYEAMIREQPEQYLWCAKRFKTRPPSEPKLYE